MIRTGEFDGVLPQRRDLPFGFFGQPKIIAVEKRHQVGIGLPDPKVSNGGHRHHRHRAHDNPLHPCGYVGDPIIGVGNIDTRRARHRLIGHGFQSCPDIWSFPIRHTADDCRHFFRHSPTQLDDRAANSGSVIFSDRIRTAIQKMVLHDAV